MSASPRLKSLTIFFPFYNDAGTVEKLIDEAYEIGVMLTANLEVIAIHGGYSSDDTLLKIQKAKRKHRDLIVIDKTDNNEGYAVIKHGFNASTKEWVFYTDGDAQYHLDDLPKLILNQYETSSDVVNGYKIERRDGFLRTILGNLYEKFSNFIFELPIRDTDCDFRLIRKSFLDKIYLVSKDASVLGELIKKLELVGAKFSEVPVSHYRREYGISNYTPASLLKEKFIGDICLYFKIRKIRGAVENLRVLKFASIGVVSVAIQSTLFNILIIFFGNHPSLAVVFSDQVAIALSFILNNQITFNDRKHRAGLKMASAFAKFYIIVTVSTLFQALVVWAGVRTFGNDIIVANLFFIIGLALAFIWNFRVQKRLVWKK